MKDPRDVIIAPVVSEKSSSSRQYMIVGFVLAVSAGLLWFMRGQGIGVELAEGKDQTLGFLIGQCMRKLKGRANPKDLGPKILAKVRGG